MSIMPNLAIALRDEIRRLAKKEAKALLRSSLRTTVQHRREIAQLKRQLHMAERRLVYLERQERRRIVAPAAAAAVNAGPRVRFSARSVRAQRQRLDLSAHDYGKLLGVSGQTVYFWEQGKSRPRTAQMARLVEARNLNKREARMKLKILRNGQAGGRAGKK
jgi:DNA-binding transcriptional regulator YiaG